ncbi:MAG: DUF192 domain-containing protein [Pseudomonadota bacterium]|nr:DUF192 domain-containing protein [Pseudomonadota bacterium]
MKRALFAAPLLALLGASSLAAAVEGLDVVTSTGAHHYEVEIANDAATREHGLMLRETMAPDHGMLFEFPAREPVSFWMKDTLLPLDMVFIDIDGTVVRVEQNAKPLSEAIIPSGGPVTGVLELNAGQAAAIHLKPGDKVNFPFFLH